MKRAALVLLFFFSILIMDSVIANEDCRITGSVSIIPLRQVDLDTYETVPYITPRGAGNTRYVGDIKILNCQDLGKSVNVSVELFIRDFSGFNLTQKKFIINFIVDRETNTFKLNNTRVLFPFYIFGNGKLEFRPFHIFEFLKVERMERADVYLTNTTKIAIPKPIDIMSTREFTYIFCYGTLLPSSNTTCDSPVKIKYANLLTKPPYVVGSELLYPKDPFGIYEGPVLLGFEIQPSDEILKFLESDTSENESVLLGLIVLLGVGLFIVAKSR
ncbi:hypothetical protein A3L04_00215 [Thermococcus chitonophagus]|uniref:Uncharacterized protein n=1 Tax=Thermococcus chitonophagus TaxID=54262 RepID=A0A160VPV6_9EURY|nr:hypothetical protein [Thermococcus chitonophagus]ASJ15607.1 hypothetical protein A3L04_00215 [Thermococcus chitonophagus]CUX76815.1 hypothetical protein CHITON_0036 [Thermococcus chitonophagus]